MKNVRPSNHLPLNAVVTLAVIIFILTACSIFRGGSNGSSGRGDSSTGWKVWVKTNPCAGGRTDWISVAKENPTYGAGGDYWQTADLIMTPQACTTVTDDSCTFAEADASANVIRASGKFSTYCCRDWNVWRNTATGEMSIVKGSSSAGFGWQFEKGQMCCEEAENLTGKSGLCGGNTANNAAPPLGPVRPGRTPNISQTPVSTDGITIANNGGSVDDDEVATTNRTRAQTPPPVAVSNRWILISTTVSPANPSETWTHGEWAYNAQSTSAHYSIYNGGITSDFQWTAPPPQIDAGGFTITYGVQAIDGTGGRNSSIIRAYASGMTSDTPDDDEHRVAAANADKTAGRPTASAQKSITFKPVPSSNELEVKVGMQWAVTYTYKYRRA